MDDKKLLLIGDMAGVGKVGLGAMLPVLDALEVDTTTLLTSLVSNNFDYGEFELLDTTEYLINTIKKWNKLNFKFDFIATGYIATIKEARAIYDYLLENKKRGVKVLVDPIMGEAGQIYPGLDSKNVEAFKLIANLADVIVPNLTEATLLTNTYVGKTNVNEEELDTLVNKMSKLTKGNIVITSVSLNNKKCVVLKESNKDTYEKLYYDEINIALPGTGDIFSSVLIGNYMNGKSIKESTLTSMEVVRNLISKNTNLKDYKLGIPLEKFYKEIRNEKTKIKDNSNRSKR